MNFRHVLSFAAASLAIASVYACGSSSDAASQAAGGNCPTVGEKACPNDDAVTQDDVDQCNAARSGACSSSYVSALECEGNNVMCNSSGMTDSTNLESKCGSQLTAYSTCALQHATTDGGS
jgi:hypothetical protein